MRTQADIDGNAGALKEDGLPDRFNRLLGTTPEKLDATKEVSMAQKIGPREQALRAMREAESKPVPVSALKKIVEAPAPMKKDRPAPAATEPKPEAPAPDEPKETPVSPTKKKTAKKTAKKAPKKRGAQAAAAPKTGAKGKTLPAPQTAPTNGSATMMPRPGSKNETMLTMALQPEGATEKAICKKLGWQRCRVTLRRVCAKAGATLTSEGTGEDRVYKAVLPAAA